MELKLLVDPGARPLVERHPAFSAVKSKTRKETTTYYDTADLALYRLGASLRVRQSGKGFVQTVKVDRPDDPVGTRGEWEWTVPSGKPDLDRLASLPEDAGTLRAAAEKVGPLFETIVERTSWLLRQDDGTAIEAVFDAGIIRAGDKSRDISEVELELKEGSPAQVFRLAIDLTERVGMRFGSLSKSQRGYGLVSDCLPDRPPAALPSWDKRASIGVVFPSLVQAGLRELAAEIPLASTGSVEGVHRMRAAIRKLRSVLVLFDPYLDRRAARKFKLALRDLGAVLGRGRDWDVFLTETLPMAEARDAGADAGLLRGPAEIERGDAHAAIAQAMRDPPLTGLILGMGLWTLESHWLRKVKPRASLEDLVPDLLNELDHKARKLSRRLDLDDVTDLHDLRKSLKKLRYSVEFVSPLFAQDDVGAYLHAIKAVLAVLGGLNDSAVTERRIEDIAPVSKAELAPAVSALLRHTEARRAKALGKLPKALKNLFTIKTFWT